LAARLLFGGAGALRKAGVDLEKLARFGNIFPSHLLAFTKPPRREDGNEQH
jgi:hypothetical protein